MKRSSTSASDPLRSPASTRGDVNRREHALPREGVRQQRAVLHFLADALDVARQFRVGQAVGQQLQALQNRQTGANQGHELLVENQELFDVELLAAGTQALARRPRCGAGSNKSGSLVR